jgi:hypothetical protein
LTGGITLVKIAVYRKSDGGETWLAKIFSTVSCSRTGCSLQ